MYIFIIILLILFIAYINKDYNTIPKKIWTYVDGHEKTVESCIESWKKYTEYEITVLTKHNYMGYVTIPTEFLQNFENNGLIGYRIEYLDTNSSAPDAKIHNFFKVVTSNNRAEAVNQNLTNSNQKAIRYRFNDNSSLVFCTLSPASASNVKPNALPYIGQPNQQIIITNTFFNPIMIEVEMVEQDIETLAYGIFGNQTKSLEDGIYTIYNFNNDIYKQYDLYEIKDRFTGAPLFEIREQRTSIDFTKRFSTVTTV